MTSLDTNAYSITGAAGTIGSTLRAGLRNAYRLLRVSDVRSLGRCAAGEEAIEADLTEASRECGVNRIVFASSTRRRTTPRISRHASQNSRHKASIRQSNAMAAHSVRSISAQTSPVSTEDIRRELLDSQERRTRCFMLGYRALSDATQETLIGNTLAGPPPRWR